ncbi:MAG: biopolymer transporter ExbD [bacterium]|nr:biopolymer transporter ExbD [bacterium]
MSRKKRGQGLDDPANEANITPLADVVTTLIVVFLMTMPAMLWSGIQVNATKATAGSEVVHKDKSTDEKMTVVVMADGLEVDGESVRVEDLAHLTRRRLAGMSDHTVIVVPQDEVLLGKVVTVMDVLKQNGAKGLALLNRVKAE